MNPYPRSSTSKNLFLGESKFEHNAGNWEIRAKMRNPWKEGKGVIRVKMEKPVHENKSCTEKKIQSLKRGVEGSV